MSLWIDHDHDPEQGLHVYNIPQVPDPEYKEFWDWAASQSIRYSYSDWPHSGFALFEGEVRDALHEKWGKYIHKGETRAVNLKNFHDSEAPVDETTPEAQLAKILREEIDKEVARQILEKVERTA